MKLFFLLTLLALAMNANAQVDLQVKVMGIRVPKGTIRVGLFDSEKTFLKTAAYGEVVSATGPEVVVIFKNIPEGEYGLSVIHDENQNGELDSNFIGIPKEGFAFGNNAMGTFGPPSFRTAMIKADGLHLTHEIKLKYM